MSETLDYIDQYFTGTLSPAEREAFENRIQTDQTFAEEIAFYISARAALKTELHEQKKQDFYEQYVQLSTDSKAASPGIVKKLRPYIVAAAACLLIFLGWQLFFKAPSARQLADEYIKDNLLQGDVPMGNSVDSVELGKAAFRAKNYGEAEHLFETLTYRKNSDPEAIRYLGIVYLVTGKYDRAIAQFDALSQLQLHTNYGPFYKALTLMKRSEKGDKAKAKEVLQEVIRKDLPGSKEAAFWIRKL